MPYKNDPQAISFEPPAEYPFLKKEDWKLFVAQRLSKKWQVCLILGGKKFTLTLLT